MSKWAFQGMIEIPVIGSVNLQRESKELEEGKSTAAYLFGDEKSASKFANDVKKYVKNAEVVGGNKKNQFKVRLQLNKDDGGKNKDTIKVVSLAQKNYGKIDIREAELLESIISTVFFAPKARGMKDWANDTQDAVEKAKEDDEEGNDIDPDDKENDIDPDDKENDIEEGVKTLKHNASDYEIMTQGKDKYILYKQGKNKRDYARHSLTKQDLDKELKKLGYNFNDFKEGKVKESSYYKQQDDAAWAQNNINKALKKVGKKFKSNLGSSGEDYKVKTTDGETWTISISGDKATATKLKEEVKSTNNFFFGFTSR